MNRKQRRALGIAAAVLVLVVVFQFLGGTSEPPPPPAPPAGAPPGAGDPGAPKRVEEPEVPVVVAKATIGKQTKIRPEMVGIVKVPQSLRNSDAATDVNKVVDRYAQVRIFEREQMLFTRLGDSSNLDVGMSYLLRRGNRAVSIPMSTERAVAGYISPGTIVDIMGSFKYGSQGDSITRSVLRRKKILAINDKYIVDRSGKGPAPKPPEPGKEGDAAKADQGFQQLDGINSITIEVTPEEGEKLLLAAQSTGLHLEIVHPEAEDKVDRPVTGEEVRAIPKAPAPDRKEGAPTGPPPPVIHRFEIIRYKDRAFQNVAEYPLTSSTAQLLTTGSAAPLPTPTGSVQKYAP